LSDALRSGGLDFYLWRASGLFGEFTPAHLYHRLFVSIIYDPALKKAAAIPKPPAETKLSVNFEKRRINRRRRMRKVKSKERFGKVEIDLDVKSKREFNLCAKD
jgi:hypothetical protein